MRHCLRRWVLICFITIPQLLSAQEVVSISGSFKNHTLSSVLSLLKERYGVVCSYDESLASDIPVSTNLRNENLQGALQKILHDTPLTYQVVGSRRALIYPKTTEESPFDVEAPEYMVISGSIIDSITKDPLPFASVRLPSLNRGCITELDGKFHFSLPSSTEEAVIEIRYLGYTTRQYKLNHKNFHKNLFFKLSPTDHNLQEVLISDGIEQSMEVADAASHIYFNPKESELLSGVGEPDILKTLQTLPGINIDEASDGWYIRGGTPGQNRVMFDGINTYSVDHFFGFFSAFNANAIKKVDVYRGNFSSKYGGRISAVVDITGRTANLDSVRWQANFNLLGANVLLESPLNHNNGSLLIAARGSYGNALGSNFYKQLLTRLTQPQKERYKESPGYDEGVSFDPYHKFYDTNIKFAFQPTKSDNISFSFIRSQDILNFGVAYQGMGGETVDEKSDFLRTLNQGASFQWGKQWRPNLYSKSYLTYSDYSTEYDYHSNWWQDSSTNARRNYIKELGLSTDIGWKLNDQHQIEAGFKFSKPQVRHLINETDTLHINNDDQANILALYMEDRFKVSRSLTLNYGIRYQFFSPTEKHYLSPRLSLNYKFTPKISLKAAWGRYYQFLSQITFVNHIHAGLEDDYWQLGGQDGMTVPKSDHYLLGLAYQTPLFLIDVETYYKSAYNLPYLYQPENEKFTGSVDPALVTTGSSHTWGVDIILQRKVGKYTGWLSYSLNEVSYQFNEINDSEPFSAPQDIRHQIKSVNQLRLGKWDFSLTWLYASGRPFTAAVLPEDGARQLRNDPHAQREMPNRSEDIMLGGLDPNQFFLMPGETNAERLPAYHRLDLGVSYSFRLAESGTGRMGVTIFNAYNQANIRAKRYHIVQTDPGQAPTLETTDVKHLGLVPNLFISLGF